LCVFFLGDLENKKKSNHKNKIYKIVDLKKKKKKKIIVYLLALKY